MSRPEFPSDVESHNIEFHEEVNRKECLITSTTYGVNLHMRSRTGPWTHVQWFHRGQRNQSSIGKASNFTAPNPVMRVFLEKCLEVL